MKLKKFFLFLNFFILKVKKIGPAKRLCRDKRCLLRKAYHEYNKIHEIGKKNAKEFKEIMKGKK